MALALVFKNGTYAVFPKDRLPSKRHVRKFLNYKQILNLHNRKDQWIRSIQRQEVDI